MIFEQDAALMSEPHAFVCGYAKHADMSPLPQFGVADALRAKLIKQDINVQNLADMMSGIWKFGKLTRMPTVRDENTSRDAFYTQSSSGATGLQGFTLSLKTAADTYMPVYTCVYAPVVQTYATVLCGNDSCREWDIAPLSDNYVGPVSFMYFVIPDYYIHGTGEPPTLPCIICK